MEDFLAFSYECLILARLHCCYVQPAASFRFHRVELSATESPKLNKSFSIVQFLNSQNHEKEIICDYYWRHNFFFLKVFDFLSFLSAKKRVKLFMNYFAKAIFDAYKKYSCWIYLKCSLENFMIIDVWMVTG